MKKDAIIRFLGKYVKLVDNNDFILRGTIDEVIEDAILFTTKQTSSLISLDSIKQVVLLGGVLGK